MIPPRFLADPVAHRPLSPEGGALVAADGERYPEALGGWDLRPHAALLNDDNKSLQADIYDQRLGEISDFDHPHNLMLVTEKELLLAQPLAGGDRVLEIGGHRSGLLAWLEHTRAIKGAGLDISPVWVGAQNAAARARNSDTVWVLGDAEHLPFADGTFALVVSLDVFEHVSQLDLALTEALRVLRPKGRLLVHMPVRDIEGSWDGWQRWRDPADYASRQASVGHFHERLPTRKQMRTRLESVGFHVLDMRSFNVWVQPLHDHRFVPMLGKLKNLRRRRAGGAAAPPATPPSSRPGPATSGFTRAYARTIVPVAAALSTVDRLGSTLGIGGSCFFVAEKADT